MNDDTLVLYYYDDGLTEDERRKVEAALEHDVDLAARYRQLESQLGTLVEVPAGALPGDLRRRLHAALDRAADGARDPRMAPRLWPAHWLPFLLGAGLTAAVALAIGLGLRATDTPAPVGVPVAVTDPVPREDATVFARAIEVYFRDSRLEVEGLPDQGNGERTAMIMDLVMQNRVFARLATQNDAPELARVLRAFEPILTRLAAEDISAEESEALRAKLAFELNVMLTRLTREASEYTTSNEQET